MSKRGLPSESFTKSSKQKTGGNDSKKQNQRKSKLYNSRQIRTSNNDPSFKDGILDVPGFLKSREYEIQQLEQAQLRSKYSASTRVFQSLPRTLRRRTASHNVKRVPKRMRRKAAREMQVNRDANKGTVKSGSTVESRPGYVKGKELYRLKLSKKLLRIAARLKLNQFGTDESHSLANYNVRNKIKSLTAQIQKIEEDKLAQRIAAVKQQSRQADTEIKLLKSKIHLNNPLGSYDNLGINTLAPRPRGNAKYRKRQKHFVWLPTHVWHTKRAHLIKRWGFQIPLRPTQKCYRSTHRNSVSDGGLISDTSYIGTVIIDAETKAELVSLLKKITAETYKIRRNKVWFGFLYIETDNVSKMAAKVEVLFSDNADKGCQAMLRLHPAVYDEIFQYLLLLKTDTITINDCRYCLGSIDLAGPLALSAITQILSPTQVSENKLIAGSTFMKLASVRDLNSLSVGAMMSLYVDDPRLNVKPVKSNPNRHSHDDSQLIDLIIDINQGKAVNHDSLQALLSFDGRLASYANQPTIKQLSSRRGKTAPGSNCIAKSSQDPSVPVLVYKTSELGYSLVLPWFWVLPFWIQLNKIPHLSLAALIQWRQIQFEQGKLAFPQDFPFLSQGFIENFVNGNEIHRKWARIQSGKKINYDKLDLGNKDEIFGKGEVGFPFNCDWEFLKLLRFGLQRVSHLKNAAVAEAPKFEVSNWNGAMQRELLNLNDVCEHIKDEKSLQIEKLAHGDTVLTNPVTLYTEKTEDESKLKIAPVSFSLLNKGHAKDSARIYAIPPADLPHWLSMTRNRHVNNKTDYQNEILVCPHANYLIGFATSANFNLAKGCATGVGYIDAEFIKERYCLVRNVGEMKARLAEFSVITDL